jgi:hypothetical protein
LISVFDGNLGNQSGGTDLDEVGQELLTVTIFLKGGF